MNQDRAESAMRIRLSDERRLRLRDGLRQYHRNQFDEPLSEFRAEAMLDFFIGQLGPAVYNQGVRDACAALQGKLADLEGEVYEPERPLPR